MKGIAQAVAAAAILALDVSANQSRPVTSNPQQPAPTPAVVGPPSPATLANAFRAIEEGERETARDRWDPADVVRQVGRDPVALHGWVRRNTSWIPYRGALRGPVGVLLDRQGNSLDRALLLATLLREAGHSVRLAHGTLSDAQSREVLLELMVQRIVTSTGFDDSLIGGVPSGTDPIAAVSQQYRLDADTIRRTLQAQAKAVDGLRSTLDARLADQTKRLLEAIGRSSSPSEWDARFDANRAAVRDHWWVQRQDGARWIELDLLYGLSGASSPPPVVSPIETLATNAVPEASQHSVLLRVVAEHSSQSGRKEGTLFEHALTPAEVQGVPIALRIAPTGTESMLAATNAGFRAAALQQHEWLFMLQVGGKDVARSLLRDGQTGDAAGSAGVSGLAGGLASILGGLEAATSGTAAPGKIELTATWLDFEVRVPGEKPRTIRRTLFDLVGPSARESTAVRAVELSDDQRLSRSLALMREVEILPVTAQLPSEFLAHLYAQSLLKNRRLIERLAAGKLPSPLDKAASTGAFVPPPGLLHRLAQDRFELSRAETTVFVDRPNLFTRHTFLVPQKAAIALRESIDIVANDVGVDLTVLDGFAARVAQGVVDTNLETLLRTTTPVIGNVGNAYATTPTGWVALSSANATQLSTLKISNDARRRMAADLAAGHIVLARQTPIVLGAEGFVGWWRIDRTTGQTLGMSADGSGGSQLQDLIRWGTNLAIANQMLLLAMTDSFLFSLYLCDHGIVDCLPGAIGGAVFAYGMNNGFGSGRFWRSVYRDTRGGVGAGGGGGGSRGPSGAPGAAAGAGTQRAGGGVPGGTGPASPGGGKGPYFGDPLGRQMINDNPNSIATQAMGGKELFEGADHASSEAYRVARNLGNSDDAAHAISRRAFDEYLARWRPKGIVAPGVPGGYLPYGQNNRVVVGAEGPNPVGQTTGVPGQGGSGGTVVSTPPAGTGGQSGKTLPLAPPSSGPPSGPPPCAQSPCAKSVSDKLVVGMISVQAVGTSTVKR